MPPRHVAVLGAGISGLTTAFYLQKLLPAASRITVIEKDHRVGGWIKSFPIEGSRIALEAGPRTFRSAGSASTLQLLKDLNLEDKIVAAPRNSPAGKMRYVYMDGRLSLLPAAPYKLLFRPDFWWIIGEFYNEMMKAPNRPEFEGYDDESIGDLFQRRFSTRFARLASAAMHGIYAADIKDLSVKATFPFLAHAERLGKGSLVNGFADAAKMQAQAQRQIRKLMRLGPLGELRMVERMSTAFTLEGGMEMVPQTLLARLAESENVDVRLSTEITKLDKIEGDFEISLKDGSKLMASHVVSSIPNPALHKIIQSSSAYEKTPLDKLNYSPDTTAQVLNLVFPPTDKPIHPPGFGFLVSRPEAGYPQEPTTLTSSGKPILQNLLGVVFDSMVDPEHDHQTQPTIMTLMMGGPFPLYNPQPGSLTLSPENLQIFLDTLEHYLDCGPLPTPLLNAFHTHYNCIPTPKPGAPMAFREVLNAAKKGEWGPRLQLIGSVGGSVGVGLRGAIDSARSTAFLLPNLPPTHELDS